MRRRMRGFRAAGFGFGRSGGGAVGARSGFGERAWLRGESGSDREIGCRRRRCSGGATAWSSRGRLGGFLGGAFGVEDEEAIDDFVFEGLELLFLGGVQRAVGWDLDVAPAVGVEHRAIELFVESAQGEDARV